MHIIDSHFHWWPPAVFENMNKGSEYPWARANDRGGFTYCQNPGDLEFPFGQEWFDLDMALGYLDGLGHNFDVVCSMGPFAVHYSQLPVEAGQDAAEIWNSEMARAQRQYPGRVWGTAAVPMVDTDIALAVLNRAINEHKLVGVNVPASIGKDPYIDAERLEPFYARCAELDVPILLHPTDAIFPPMLQGYNHALYASLGRVIEVSVVAMRLILSGIMERHPTLRVSMSHIGGALPYQAGRMDKNSKSAGLPQPPSTYIKRMYTDTVSPHPMGMKFAIEFYGVENILYGSDYPCWMPKEALAMLDQLDLSESDQNKIFSENARRFFRLPAAAKTASLVNEKPIAA